MPFLPEIEDLTLSLFSVGEGTQLRLPILPEFTFPALPVAVFAGIPISIRVLAVRKAGLWARLPILPQIGKGVAAVADSAGMREVVGQLPFLPRFRDGAWEAREVADSAAIRAIG